MRHPPRLSVNCACLAGALLVALARTSVLAQASAPASHRPSTIAFIMTPGESPDYWSEEAARRLLGRMRAVFQSDSLVLPLPIDIRRRPIAPSGQPYGAQYFILGRIDYSDRGQRALYVRLIEVRTSEILASTRLAFGGWRSADSAALQFLSAIHTAARP